jgi:hypothetical protein
MIRHYTGVGGRKTPATVLAVMHKLALNLAADWTLRSGGALGADSAFESAAGKACQIFLPWKGFNGHPSEFYHIMPDAFSQAESIHPAWFRCSQGARKLHARNVHQLLGPDLKTPSECVICWTEGGKTVGGTGTAIRLAAIHNIPVFNLATLSPKAVWTSIINLETSA